MLKFTDIERETTPIIQTKFHVVGIKHKPKSVNSIKRHFESMSVEEKFVNGKTPKLASNRAKFDTKIEQENLGRINSLEEQNKGADFQKKIPAPPTTNYGLTISYSRNSFKEKPKLIKTYSGKRRKYPINQEKSEEFGTLIKSKSNVTESDQGHEQVRVTVSANAQQQTAVDGSSEDSLGKENKAGHLSLSQRTRYSGHLKKANHANGPTPPVEIGIGPKNQRLKPVTNNQNLPYYQRTINSTNITNANPSFNFTNNKMPGTTTFPLLSKIEKEVSLDEIIGLSNRKIERELLEGEVVKVKEKGSRTILLEKKRIETESKRQKDEIGNEKQNNKKSIYEINEIKQKNRNLYQTQNNQLFTEKRECENTFINKNENSDQQQINFKISANIRKEETSSSSCSSSSQNFNQQAVYNNFGSEKFIGVFGGLDICLKNK